MLSLLAQKETMGTEQKKTSLNEDIIMGVISPRSCVPTFNGKKNSIINSRKSCGFSFRNLKMEKMKMSISDLPPGFRFSPTDQELIIHYLKQKVSFPSSNAVVSTIADVDIYKFNPWDLPGKALFGENEWFFFSPRDRKYPNGARPNRAAASGYWKATGTDKPILCSGGSQCLGVKKALVFYMGRPQKGIKTNWMMLEYRLLDDNNPSYRIRGSMRLDDWVLCRIRQKRNTLQKGEQNYDLNSGFSILPQGQKILQYNDLLEYGNGFQAYLMDPLENEEAEEHEQMNNKKGSQEGSDSSVETNLQAQVVSSFNEALESIKKTLSFGALDELVAVPPKKRQQTSAPNEADGENIFHVPSLIPPASFPLCFSDFMS